MLALTCDTCGKPATVFFMDGVASCNGHGQHFTTENDFGIPKHTLGYEHDYDSEGRYRGMRLRAPA